MPTIAEMQAHAKAAIADAPQGEPLDALTEALVTLGVRTSVTCLAGIEPAVAAARAAGATPAQMQEVIALVSALGVHSLMVSAPVILAAAGTAGDPLTSEQQALWSRHVGDDPYWRAFEAEVPGFLDALLRTAPALFEGFFAYCAIPWTTRHVPALTKELVAIACDVCPTHRFGPGLRLHIRNALKLGAGRTAILETLAIAATATEHLGVA